MSRTAVFLILVPVIALVIAQNLQQRTETITGCERANVIRQQLWTFADGARERNINSLPSQKGSERKASQEAIRDYTEVTTALVAAVADNPKSEGSPQVNCEEAFEYPFPINFFK
jgi:hypothetical protein